MADGIFSGLRASVQTDEELALQVLFPYRDKFTLQQALTEQQARAITPWSVLGVFRKRYKSQVLKDFQAEYNINKVALDRKGRIEASEIFASRGRSIDKDDE